MRRLLAAAALVLSLAAPPALVKPALAAPSFPALSGRVVDQANILSPQVESDLTARLAALEAETGRQLAVATLSSLQGYEIEDYGYQLGRAWGIGEAKTDTGALFLVAPTERKVRIEVGYGLEPVLTDTLSSVILQTAVIPRFKAGDMSGGVVAGTGALIQQLSLPDGEARARAAAAGERSSSQDRGSALHPIAVVLLLILFFGFFGRRGRRGRGGIGDVVTGMVIGGAMSHLGRGGRGGFGGGGGGGWSGGGGSFGGGGSSGSW